MVKKQALGYRGQLSSMPLLIATSSLRCKSALQIPVIVTLCGMVNNSIMCKRSNLVLFHFFSV